MGAVPSPTMLSPSVDFGKDFDILLHKCISEKKHQTQSLHHFLATLPEIKCERLVPEMKEANSVTQNENVDINHNGTADVPVQLQEQMTEPRRTNACESDRVTGNIQEQNYCACVKSKSATEPQFKVETDTEFGLKIHKKTESLTFMGKHKPAVKLKVEGAFNVNGGEEVTFKTRKTKKGKVKEKKDKIKKWKPALDILSNFNLSLLPWRQPATVVSDVDEADMNKEFKEFEKICKHSEVGREDIGDPTEATTSAIIQTESTVDTSIQRHNYENRNQYDCDDSEDTERLSEKIEDYFSYTEDKIPVTIIRTLESDKNRRLRSKKKWHVEKARKQVKTKHCTSFSNCAHGTKLYMHHRVLKQLTKLAIHKEIYLPFISRRAIDRKADKIKASYLDCEASVHAYGLNQANADRKLSSDLINVLISLQRRDLTPEDYEQLLQLDVRVHAYSAPYQNPRPVPQPAHTRPAYALNRANADCDLSSDLINVLINLQDRDLTPEDYELLLQLDERVAPKTVEKNILESFKTDEITETPLAETCAICMDEYSVGQICKFLPCGHKFHAACINMWLEKSSMNCPLDGMAVTTD